MGINNFNKWIKQNYAQCFKNIKNNCKYDNMCIDLNHILHACTYGSNNYKEYKSKLFNTLDTLLSNFIITKNIIIAIDGPAPYSKLILQRKRRLASIKNVDMGNLSSIHLTPGTKFMRYIDNIMDEYIRITKNKFKFNKVNIQIFNSSYPDEGELKLFKYISKNSHNKNQSYIIVGNDADLIVMIVANLSLYNTSILIKEGHIHKLLNVCDMIESFYSKNISKNNIHIKLNNTRHDFSCLSLMMGNDYLPKLQIVKFDTLFDSYNRVIRANNIGLIKDGKFNRQFLMKFIADIIHNLPKQYKRFDFSRYNPYTVKSYLCGILWCLNMYITGICSKYDYMFNGDFKPTPCDIQHYIITTKCSKFNNDVDIPISNTKPISSKYYGIYVLPKRGLSILPKNIRTIAIKELKELHDVEECEDCKLYSENIGIKNKLIQKAKKGDDTRYINSISDTIRKLIDEYTDHKRTIHNNREFCVDDIKKLSKVKCLS